MLLTEPEGTVPLTVFGDIKALRELPRMNGVHEDKHGASPCIPVKRAFAVATGERGGDQ